MKRWPAERRKLLVVHKTEPKDYIILKVVYGKSTILQCKAVHPRVYSQHKLNLIRGGGRHKVGWMERRYESGRSCGGKNY